MLGFETAMVNAEMNIEARRTKKNIINDSVDGIQATVPDE
jgi:hypothetical protein